MKKFVLSFVITPALFLFILSHLAVAQEEQTEGVSAGEAEAKDSAVLFVKDAPDSAGAGSQRIPQVEFNYFKYVVITGIFIVAICALLYLLKRFLKGGGFLSKSNAITVVTKKQIDPVSAVYLIEIGHKLIRVGASKNGLVYLGEVSDKDEIALIKAQSSNAKPDASPAVSFNRSLDEFTKEIEERDKDSGQTQKLMSIKHEIDEINEKITSWKDSIK